MTLSRYPSTSSKNVHILILKGKFNTLKICGCSLSLSLYIYIYIHTHTHTHTHIYFCPNVVFIFTIKSVLILYCLQQFVFVMVTSVFFAVRSETLHITWLNISIQIFKIFFIYFTSTQKIKTNKTSF